MVWRMKQICCFQKLKGFQLQEPLSKGSALNTAGGSARRPHYPLAMRVHPTFFDLATPLSRRSRHQQVVVVVSDSFSSSRTQSYLHATKVNDVSHVLADSTQSYLLRRWRPEFNK